MRTHIQILGILNIIWGCFGLVAALIIFAIFGGAIGVIHATAHGDTDAAIAVPIVGLIGSIILVVILVLSIPSVLAGIGLLRMAPWARTFTIIVSVLHLLNIPFGTALGIYGLWVMMSDETTGLFTGNPSPIRL